MRKQARTYYASQKHCAKVRNIDFNLTFEEWDSWWLSHGVDRNIPRKFNKSTLSMCRYGDIGPYALNNIYCATMQQNSKDKKYVQSPHAKQVSTPDGIFKSVSEVARFYNKDRATILHRIQNWPDYYFL